MDLVMTAEGSLVSPPTSPPLMHCNSLSVPVANPNLSHSVYLSIGTNRRTGIRVALKGQTPRVPMALPRLRKKLIGRQINRTQRILVRYFTSLCPFGRTFVSVRTHLWFFLHQIGFTVHSSPYEGRRMRLTSISRLATFSCEVERAKGDADLRRKLFPSNTDYQLLRRIEAVVEFVILRRKELIGDALPDAAATSSVASPPPNGTKETWQQSLAVDVVNFVRELSLPVTSQAVCERDSMDMTAPRSAAHDPETLPVCASLDSTCFELQQAWIADLRLFRRIPTAAGCADQRPPCSEPFVFLPFGDLDRSVMVPLRAAVSLEKSLRWPLPSLSYVLSATSTDSATTAVRGCVSLLLSAARHQAPPIAQRRGVRIAFVRLHMSTGVCELDDVLSCISMLHLHEPLDSAAATPLESQGVDSSVSDDGDAVAFRWSERVAPILDLSADVVDAIVVQNAHLFSHRALRRLSEALEENTRKANDAQHPSDGLLHSWAPYNGGVAVFCVGLCDDWVSGGVADPDASGPAVTESTATTPHSPSLITMTLPIADDDDIDADDTPSRNQASTHHKRSSANGKPLSAEALAVQRSSLYFRIVTSVMDAVSSSRSVTSRSAASELGIRETLVQAFLRSTRPISVPPVVELLQSQPRHVGAWLLHSVEAPPATTQSTATPPTAACTVDAPVVTAIVAALNGIKALAARRSTRTEALRRLEILQQTNPLVNYVVIHHKTLCRWIPWDAASVRSSRVGGVASQRLVNMGEIIKRIRFLRQNPASAVSISSGVELVASRNEELRRLDGRFEASVSCSGAVGRAASYTSLFYYPRPRQPTTTTVVACVHESTSLRVIRDAVFEQIRSSVPPGLPVADVMSHCVVFPLDYVTFVRSSVRRCVGVRLVLDVSAVSCPQEAMQMVSDAGELLQSAVSGIQSAGVPFALECVPRACFNYSASLARHGVQDLTSCGTGAERSSGVESPRGRQSDGADDNCGAAEGSFPLINEAATLIYPNIVESRLIALAASVMPDLRVAVGDRVFAPFSAAVLLWSSAEDATSHAEVPLPPESRQVIRSKAEQFGEVVGFVESSEVVSALGAPSAVAALGRAAAANEVHRVLEHFCGAHAASVLPERQHKQTCVRLPLVRLAATSLELPDARHTTAIAVVVWLPHQVEVGGAPSTYEYVLPVVGLSLVNASHISVCSRYDPLLAVGARGHLLRHLAQRDPMVEELSRYASPPIFREPPIDAGQCEDRRLRLAVAKSTRLVDELLRDGEGGQAAASRDMQLIPNAVSQHNGDEVRTPKPWDEQQIVARVDERLLSAECFTEAVYL